LRDDFAAIGVHGLASPLLDLMNVRWLIAAQPPASAAPGRWVERYRPGPDAAQAAPAAARWEPSWNSMLGVYENMHVLPRAFVVHAAEVPGDDARLGARLVAPDFDPARVALLEEPPGVPLPAASVTAPAAAMTRARTLEARRTRVVIETDDAAPGVLVIGDAHYPGWTATVDGAPTKLLRADWAFRGVALPAGRHRVELRYRSRPTEAGIALSLIGVALLCALALTESRRRVAARVDAAMPVL
jgi:hypothetical protein